MINAEQDAALTPYRINQILGDTNYRNIGVGESGYWNASTGRRSALLDQSKEYQELKNMEFAGRLTSAQESQILLDSKAPASGGAAASAAPSPSLQAFRPDFSDVGSALASMAQARAAMLDAEQNAALTPYKIDQIRGATDYRNIGIGESGYWKDRKSTRLNSSHITRSRMPSSA